MSVVYIDPWHVEPRHEPRVPVDELSASMAEEGWRGRALLVVEVEGGFQALTGSHRIAAARKAGLEAIPCYVLELPDGQAWVDELWDAITDHELRRAILKSMDTEAIRLMSLEK